MSSRISSLAFSNRSFCGKLVSQGNFSLALLPCLVTVEWIDRESDSSSKIVQILGNERIKLSAPVCAHINWYQSAEKPLN